MLRAGHKKQLSIMFPLISSLDEFKTARAILDECVNELDADRIPHNREPKVGVMIEIPSAVIQAEALASAADFLSIGTNDLVQYLLGVDRTNSQVSHMYNPMHPAVLRSLRYITEGAKVHGRPVSICGEAAASKRMLVFLIGLGVELISVDPRLIPYVRQEISEIDSSEAARISNRMLKMSRTQEIEDYLGTIGI